MKQVSKRDIKKYNIESTTDGYPQLELALHKAKESLGWKGLTAHLVNWCGKNQPTDTTYDLQFWVKQAPVKIKK